MGWLEGSTHPLRLALYAFCAGFGAITLALLANWCWEAIGDATWRPVRRWLRTRWRVDMRDVWDVLLLPVKAVFPTPPWKPGGIPLWARPLDEDKGFRRRLRPEARPVVEFP